MQVSHVCLGNALYLGTWDASSRDESTSFNLSINTNRIQESSCLDFCWISPSFIVTLSSCITGQHLLAYDDTIHRIPRIHSPSLQRKKTSHRSYPSMRQADGENLSPSLICIHLSAFISFSFRRTQLRRNIYRTVILPSWWSCEDTFFFIPLVLFTCCFYLSLQLLVAVSYRRYCALLIPSSDILRTSSIAACPPCSRCCFIPSSSS